MLKNWFNISYLIIAILIGETAFGQAIFIENHSIEDQFIQVANVKGKINLHSEIRPFLIQEYRQSESSVSKRFSEKYNVWNSKEEQTSVRLYTNKNYFFHANHENNLITINPVIAIESGNQDYFRNTRGFEITGHLSHKLSFYTRYTENQFTTPDYVKDIVAGYQNNFPGYGRFRNFDGSYVPHKVLGYDSERSKAYLNYSINDNLLLSFGKNSFFIGDGYRSMILSDFSNEYLNMTFRAKIWRFNYQATIGEFLNAPNFVQGTKQIRKKHGAFHYLSTRFGDNLTVGVFEGVVINRGDSATQGRFDWNYANPFIFYRSVEYQLGSPDNMLFGLNTSYKLFKTAKIYAQLMFDEFHVGYLLRDDQKWWANKYSTQIGGHYFDAFGIESLHINAEYNVSRPYTYSHWSYMQAYTNNGQPLAHPMGANFKELIIRSNYEISEKLRASLIIVSYSKGMDTSSLSYGGDLLKSYYDRPERDFGHVIGQGLLKQVQNASFTLTYEPFNNVWLDATYCNRREEIEGATQSINWYSLGIRMNLDRIQFDY